ncbi:hypothetical protein TruAng_010117 [Truncatella angustata]|nr:hypothetical protein TruAng_010117 [Truncatella angustata]
MATARDAQPSVPALPPNVSIFSPTDPNAAKTLLSSRIFTRLSISAQTEPAQLTAALKNPARPEISEAFCLSHGNAVLIFDGGSEGSDLEDSHHEHFRLVCLALKDADISLDVAGCVFDTADVLQAGFQLDTLSSGSVLVIDLMSGGDDDSSDEDEDDNSTGQGFLMSGDSGATIS